MDVSQKEHTKIKKVPPENGYAYIVSLGFTVTFAVCMAHSNSFGLMFNDFLKENSDSTSVLTSVNGLSGVMICLSGALVNQGKRWFSLRQMALFGCACYTMCWILNAFLTSVYQMYFTISILNGVGWGIIMVTAYNVFNLYFIKKRVMMMGICMSIVGFVSIFFPFFIEYCLNQYGYRGMMALVGAFTAHSIVGSALFQPIEWHLVPQIVYKDDNTNNERDNLSDVLTNKMELTVIEQYDPLLTQENVTTLKLITDRQNNIIVEHNPVSSNINDELPRKKIRGIWQKLSEELDLSLLKTLPVLNITLAMGLGMIGDIYFYLLQPLLLFEYGFTQVTKCISTTSIADLTARLSLAVVGRYSDVKSRHLFYISMCCTTIGRFAFLQFKDFVGVIIMTAIVGFFRGWFYVTLPLIFAETVSMEKFTAAYGLGLLFNGLFNVILSPIIGLGKDVTGSYVGSFYIITSLCLIIIILWTYEFFFMKKKP